MSSTNHSPAESAQVAGLEEFLARAATDPTAAAAIEAALEEAPDREAARLAFGSVKALVYAKHGLTLAEQRQGQDIAQNGTSREWRRTMK